MPRCVPSCDQPTRAHPEASGPPPKRRGVLETQENEALPFSTGQRRKNTGRPAPRRRSVSKVDRQTDGCVSFWKSCSSPVLPLSYPPRAVVADHPIPSLRDDKFPRVQLESSALTRALRFAFLSSVSTVAPEVRPAAA